MKLRRLQIAILAAVLLIVALTTVVCAASDTLDAANALSTDVSVVSKQVSVLPEDEECNIPMHQVWPILFFASLAFNIAAVVVIMVILLKKKNLHKDDIPLVDYDIDYDANTF